MNGTSSRFSNGIPFIVIMLTALGSAWRQSRDMRCPMHPRYLLWRWAGRSAGPSACILLVVTCFKK
jgi:hypothetical protein